MASTNKVLGQASPLADTETALYTAPSQAIVSTLVICNRSADPSSFRVSVAINGAATEDKQFIYYDVLIAGNDSFAATIGMTLAANDVVRVYAADAVLSFTLFGQEIS